jgi:hypothetical protein
MTHLSRPAAAVAASAFALLTLVGAAAGCSSTDNGSSPPTTVASSSSGTKGTSAAGSPSTTAGTSGPSLADQELGGYRFQVRSAEVLDDSKALLPPSAGNVIVGIDVSMTNVSDQDQPVSTFAQLELKTSGGKPVMEIPPDSPAGAFKDGTLKPGETVQGLVLYEVPEAAISKLLFSMAGDLTDNRVTVELSLAPR